MLEFKTAFIDPATLLGKKPAVAAAPAVAGFVIAIAGTTMALLIRLERIAAGTHGQVTLGWEHSRC